MGVNGPKWHPGNPWRVVVCYGCGCGCYRDEDENNVLHQCPEHEKDFDIRAENARLREIVADYLAHYCVQESQTGDRPVLVAQSFSIETDAMFKAVGIEAGMPVSEMRRRVMEEPIQ